MKQTVINLSEKDVPLESIVFGGEIILGPHLHVNDTYADSDLVRILKKYLEDLQKTPNFNINDPVYIIFDANPWGFAASIMIEAFFMTFATTVHTWIVLGNGKDGKGKYLRFEEFRSEGNDLAQRTTEHHRRMFGAWCTDGQCNFDDSFYCKKCGRSLF